MVISLMRKETEDRSEGMKGREWKLGIEVREWKGGNGRDDRKTKMKRRDQQEEKQ